MKPAKIDITDSELVVFINKLCGGVTYRKEDEQQLEATNDDEELSQWTSKKTIYNKRERDDAMAKWAQVRRSVEKLTVETLIGRFCPMANKDELIALDEKIRTELAEFNRKSYHSRIEYVLLFFPIKGNEAEIANAVNNEISGILAELIRALKKKDPKAIRAVANKARGIEKILKTNEAKAIKDVVESSRKLAKEIVKSANEKADDIDGALQANSTAINTARMIFLEPEDDKRRVSGSEVDQGRFSGL